MDVARDMGVHPDDLGRGSARWLIRGLAVRRARAALKRSPDA